MASPDEISAVRIWLDAWERAAGLPPGRRAEELLRTAGVAENATLLLGARDALLFELRAALFGSDLDCVSSCPRCAERCEWECSMAALRRGPGDAPGADVLELSDGAWQLRFRPVTAADLAAVSEYEDEAAVVRALLRRCVLEAHHQGADAADCADLPETLIERISTSLAVADPQAATSVELACPACTYRWEASFDIAMFLWTELETWAQRTLSDVHELALRYGWSERDILALSPARRARYLAMDAA